MTDWIEGYKLGFKEGVEAVKTQLKECMVEVCMDGESYDKVVFESDIDDICEELEGE